MGFAVELSAVDVGAKICRGAGEGKFGTELGTGRFACEQAVMKVSSVMSSLFGFVA